LVDFDGDGRPDLLSGSNCCDPLGFILFRRKGDGSWEPRRELKVAIPNKAAPFRRRSFVTAADWNGDGVPDLLWREYQGIRVGPGPFKDGEPIALADQLDFRLAGVPAGAYVADFAVADWDRDGKPDLLVHWDVPGGVGGITWYQNLGGPGLTTLAEGKPLLEFPADESAIGFCVCDWNADGWPDLLVTRFERLPGRSEGGPGEYRESVWLYLRE
jgi:hypothetical protein